MHHVKTLTATFALLSWLTTATNAATAVPEVMFILDSSGSMAEPAGNQTKIEVAKAVMREIVPQIADQAAVGLTVYGHRRPGDCTDIETVFAPTEGDRQAILDQVELIEPRGKTPLSRSLLQVASGLKLKDTETTIILVSDGVDTCGGNPCQVVRQLKAGGIKFVLHVVGFDVDAPAAQQLQCLAVAGDGQYFSAQDGDALLQALQTVSVEVAGKVEAAQAEFVTAGSGLGKLRITMPQNSEKSLQALEIVRASDAKVIKKIDTVEFDSTHPLLSGEYQLRAAFAQPNHGEPTWSELGTFAITKGKTREIQLGSISFNIPAELIEGPWQQRVNLKKVVIAEAGTDKPVATVWDNKNGYYNFKPKPILAGLYNVRFQYATEGEAETVVARDVAVQPGKDAVVTLASGIRLIGNLGEIDGWDLVLRDRQTAVAEEDGPTTQAAKPLLQVRAKLGIGGSRQSIGFTYLMPAGNYDLLVHIAGMEEPLPVAENFEIVDGQILQFNTGF